MPNRKFHQDVDDLVDRVVRMAQLSRRSVHECVEAFAALDVEAARISDYTAYFYLGELVEFGETRQVFENPRDPRTEAYITGRFG